MRMDKPQLRRTMLDARENLTPEQVKALSLAAQDRVLSLPAWGSAQCVLLYRAFRNETDTALLLDKALSQGKQVLLPRCVQGEKGRMELAPITCLQDIRPGAFGIGEPDPATCSPIHECAPDLAVIPGVAFDRQGRRLGFGGGFYDRFFSGETCAPDLSTTLLAGLAYDFQIVESLPADPWDMNVHLICTDKETISCKPQS